MSDLVPATPDGAPAAPVLAAAAPTLMDTLTDPAGGPVTARVAAALKQPSVRKVLPAFVGLSAVGMAALAWSALSPTPQRTLYSQLADGDRASVVASLDQAGIAYDIDNTTGALTVSEQDFYRARMLVASDGAVAAPETGDQMLETLPMGASRTLEGERLRGARERDLELTIGEIDGVESVRVHLAEAERSAFVRENTPPSASVMVRLARGRQLSDSQVSAVINLVAASVPGLALDKVRVIDQHGRLLSDPSARDADDRLDLQARMEEKLRQQVSALLTPMLGAANFSSQIQVDLDMNEVTSAREAYDKDGVVRAETQEQSQSSAPGAAGVPGALANTPPPQVEAQAGAPQGTAPAAGGAPVNGQSSSSRTYELGREVSVSTSNPGSLRRVSVAVAVSADALKDAKAQDIADLEALVSAAVGADPQRGDTVKIVRRAFSPAGEEEALAFYETSWFAMLVRNGAAVLAVLLVLMIGVRPMVKAVRGDKPAKAKADKKAKKKGKAGTVDENGDEGGNDETPETLDGGDLTPEARAAAMRPAIPGLNAEDPPLTRAELLARQMTIAQQLVAERPENAVAALRQMLTAPAPEAEAA